MVLKDGLVTMPSSPDRTSPVAVVVSTASRARASDLPQAVKNVMSVGSIVLTSCRSTGCSSDMSGLFFTAVAAEKPTVPTME